MLRETLTSDMKSYRLIDGSGKVFIQDGAFIFIGQSELQRHHERFPEVQPGLKKKKRRREDLG